MVLVVAHFGQPMNGRFKHLPNYIITCVACLSRANEDLVNHSQSSSFVIHVLISQVTVSASKEQLMSRVGTELVQCRDCANFHPGGHFMP